MDESSFCTLRCKHYEADYEECNVPYSSGTLDEFEEVSACEQQEATCRAEGVDMQRFQMADRDEAANTPEIALRTTEVPTERNIDFSGEVDCVMTVLSLLMDSLFDEESSAVKLQRRSDHVLHSLVEEDSPCGHIVSSYCAFSIETMHACGNQQCLQRGEL